MRRALACRGNPREGEGTEGGVRSGTLGQTWRLPVLSQLSVLGAKVKEDLIEHFSRKGSRRLWL